MLQVSPLPFISLFRRNIPFSRSPSFLLRLLTLSLGPTISHLSTEIVPRTLTPSQRQLTKSKGRFARLRKERLGCFDGWAVVDEAVDGRYAKQMNKVWLHEKLAVVATHWESWTMFAKKLRKLGSFVSYSATPLLPLAFATSQDTRLECKTEG